MGIRFTCANGHKLNVKSYLAGRQGLCPYCGVPVDIPLQSTRESSRHPHSHKEGTAPTPPEPEQFTQLSQAPQTLTSDTVISLSSPTVPPQDTHPSEIATEAAFLGTTSIGTEPLGTASTGPAQEIPRMPPTDLEVELATSDATATNSVADPTMDSATNLPTVATNAAVVWGTDESPAEKLEIPGRTPSAQALEQASEILAERPSSVWYLHQGDAQRGPYFMDSIQELLQSGQIGADALLWREDWPDWREVQEVFPALFFDESEQIPPRPTVVTESPNSSPKMAISQIFQTSAPTMGSPQDGTTGHTPTTNTSKTSPINGITALVIFVASLILLGMGGWWMATRKTEPTTEPPATEMIETSVEQSV